MWISESLKFPIRPLQKAVVTILTDRGVNGNKII